MKTRYIVTYDICDPKRLRQVYKTMRGYGERLQLSVYRCDLSDRQRVRLKAALTKLIHHEQDQVLFICLGSSEGQTTNEALETVGRELKESNRQIVF